jgi:hypothetical protein
MSVVSVGWFASTKAAILWRMSAGSDAYPVSLVSLAGRRTPVEPFGDEVVLRGVRPALGRRRGVVPASMQFASADAAMLFLLLLAGHRSRLYAFLRRMQ